MVWGQWSWGPIVHIPYRLVILTRMCVHDILLIGCFYLYIADNVLPVYTVMCSISVSGIKHTHQKKHLFLRIPLNSYEFYNILFNIQIAWSLV